MEKKEQLINLISGNISPEQKANILKELKSNNKLREEFEILKNAWALSSFEQAIDPEKIERSYLSFNNRYRKKGKEISLWNITKYAAIIIVFFSIGLLTNQYILEPLNNTSNKITGNDQIVVPNGEKSELMLSDGSVVWLNSGTTLTFPVEFNKDGRKVKISGEAFFNIKKGEAPFVVSTEYGDIKVLGTTFNVRAYNNMDFQATLNEGIILFNNAKQEVILKPNQQLIISKQNGWSINTVKTENYSSWKKGVIAFESEPLEDVMKKLERHFDIQIELDKKIAQIHFTGKIFDESINEVMNYINKTKPIQYDYNKSTRRLTIHSIN